MSLTAESLFGTDGIRGRFGDFPFTADGLRRLGAAMASVMDGAALLTAMDTRFSGPEILNRVMDGLAGHCPVGRLGVLPTPGLSYLLGHGNWRYGMMITASHNPAEDNGIKLFNACGEKIPDELEAKISRIFREQSPGRSLAGSTHAASAPVLDADPRPYLDFLLDQASRIDLRGLSLLVDTANGAMCGVAPEVLARTGARLIVRSDQPDGRNINERCGSQYPEALLEKVRSEGADWGIAFDGDGDRVLLVDGRDGRISDGDDILYLLAGYRLKRTPDFRPVVVGTVMSNLGLECSLRSLGVELVRADVGDRHVYRQMQQFDAELGGESSGHVIIRSLQRSGDGLLTALHHFMALNELGRDFRMTRFPQRLQSLRVTQKPRLEDWPGLQALQEEFRRETAAKQARLLIRYSGTEPKIRIMVEADDMQVVDTWIDRLHSFIVDSIGETQ